MVIQKHQADYSQILSEKGVLSFSPNGNSMWPFIKNHKHTVVIQTPNNRINNLDVVFYTRQDGSYVLHRIVKILQDAYLIRGDSQTLVEKVPKDRVIGVMTGFYKGKKYIPSTDEKYLKKVANWYKNSFVTRLRIKNFNLRNRIKNKLKRIFDKGK